MSKAVLLSIRPQYCELITSGKKTVEVRKTRPKIETPFKCYIYCTKDKHGWFDFLKKTRLDGKVIGEFVCNKIDRIIEVPHTCFYIMGATVNYSQEIEKRSCLDGLDMGVYLGRNSKGGYAWHISDLVIYDKPKELSSVIVERYPCLARLRRPPQSWCYVEKLECEA